MRFLLDTNVFSNIGGSKYDANVKNWIGTVADTDLAVSVLTIREVRYGIERLREKDPEAAEQIDTRITALLADYGDRVLPVCERVAQEWGAMLAEKRKHDDDVGLAGTAKVHNLVLVSRNIKHYKGRKVELLDPFKEKAVVLPVVPNEKP